MPIKLPSMALIELTGPDAVAFAQAQFCNDVPSLADGHWQWNAWLSPQGRVRFFFHLLRDDSQHLRLLMRGGDPVELRDALKRFVLRSKVDIRVVDDAHIYGFDTVASLIGAVPVGNLIASSADARVIALSATRFISIESREQSDSRNDSSKWMLADIGDGFPTIARELEDAALPQWLGLDRLGAVSVKKGCYPGQEIMSRLHFKGGNKRGLFRLSIRATNLPAAGSPIAVRDESAHVGQIVMAAVADNDHCEALAILSHSASDNLLTLDAEPYARIDVLHRFE
jgi:folate-binding protein YgfZ